MKVMLYGAGRKKDQNPRCWLEHTSRVSYQPIFLPRWSGPFLMQINLTWNAIRSGEKKTKIVINLKQLLSKQTQACKESKFPVELMGKPKRKDATKRKASLKLQCQKYSQNNLFHTLIIMGKKPNYKYYIFWKENRHRMSASMCWFVERRSVLALHMELAGCDYATSRRKKR